MFIYLGEVRKEQQKSVRLDDLFYFFYFKSARNPLLHLKFPQGILKMETSTNMESDQFSKIIRNWKNIK